MININKGETKVAIFTLTEKSTLSNPYYLFEFQSDDTGNKTYITADDFSGNTPRYNSFTFSSDGIDPLDGGFTLDPGRYDYYVWETEYQYNLNVGSASNIVERGILNIVGTSSSDTYTGTDGDTEYVYNP